MATPRGNAAIDQNRKPTLIGVSTTDGSTPVAVEVDPNTGAIQISGSISVAPGGSTNFVTGQQALSTSAAQIVGARATRVSVTIVNLSTIDVYLGPSGVTSATGQLLLGTKGSAITMSVQGAVYGVAASATPSVSFEDEYN